MAEETGGAAFNAMLAIGIEPEGFQVGLDKITEIYTTWLANLSSHGIDGSTIINTASVTGITELLSTVGNQINKVQESMAALSESIIESVDKAGQSSSQNLNETISSEDKRVEAVSNAQQRILRIYAQYQERLDAKYEQEFAALVKEEEKEIRSEQEKQDRIARIYATFLARQEQELEKKAQLASKEADKEVQIEEEKQVKIARIYAQYLDKQLIEQERQAVKIKELNEKRDYEQYVAKGTGIEQEPARASGRGANIVNTLVEGGSFGEIFSGIGKSVVGLAAFQVEMAAATKLIELAISPVTVFIATIKGGFEYLQQFQERSSIIKEVLLNTVQFSANYGENFKIAGEQADVLLRKVDDLAIKLNVKSEVIQNGLNNFLELGGRNLVKNNDEAVQLAGLVGAALQTQNPNIDARTVRSEYQKLIQGSAGDNDKIAIALGLSGQRLREMVESSKTEKNLLDQINEAAPALAAHIAGANDRQVDLIRTLEMYKERFEALIVGPLFAQFTEILKEILSYLNQHEDQIKSIGVQLANAVGLAGEFTKALFTQNWSGLGAVFSGIAKTLAGAAASVNFMVAGAIAIKKLAINPIDALAYKSGLEQADTQKLVDTKELGSGVADNNYNKTVSSLKSKFSNIQSASEILAEFNNKISSVDKSELKFNSAIDGINGSVSPVNLRENKRTANFLAGSSDDLTANSTSNNLARDDYEPSSISLRNINTKPAKNPGAERGVTLSYQGDVDKIKQDAQKLLEEQKESLASGDQNLKQYTNASVDILEVERIAVDRLIEKYSKLAAAKAGKGKSSNEIKTYSNASTVFNTQIDKQESNLTVADTKADAKDSNAADEANKKASKAKELQDTKNIVEFLKTSDASQLEIARAVKHEHELDYAIQKETLQAQLVAAITLKDKATISGAINLVDSKAIGTSYTDDKAVSTAKLKEENDLIKEQIVANNANFDIKKKAYEEDVVYAKTTTGSQDKYTEQSKLHQQKIDLDKQALATNKENLILLQAQLANIESQVHTEEQLHSIQNQITVQRAKVKESSTITDLDNKTVDPNSAAAIERLVFSDNDLQKLSDVFTQGFSKGVTDITKAFDYFSNITKNYTQGFKQGGVLGGVGAVLSGQGGNLLGKASSSLGKFGEADSEVAGGASELGSIASPVGSVLGAAGPFIGAIGPAFAIIGSILTAAAKKTADQAKKDFQAIQTSYGEGNINLSQAITEQQNVITSTITKLSGEKGGKSEIDAIIPGMQQSLDSLVQQQKQIFVQMDQSVANLKLQQTYLSGALSNWQQINSQVTAYVQAGGSVATAAAFISQSLEKQKIQAADDLVSAESSAVQDAQNYNNLLLQRTQLIEQYNKQAFGEKNADSIERSQAGAVVRASQLQQDTTTYQTSLQQDNQQIDQVGAKVTAEQKIFGIATDTANLQAESNALNLYSLQEQVTQWQSIQSIYNGIVKDANGNYTYTSALASLLGFTDGFGNSPTTNYNGTNTSIPGYTGAGTGNPGSIGVGYSAGGVGATSPGTVLNPASTMLTSGALSNGALTSGALSSGTVPMSNLQVGTINVTIQSSGGTIDATSIANDLHSELINRNQYAGSSYY